MKKAFKSSNKTLLLSLLMAGAGFALLTSCNQGDAKASPNFVYKDPTKPNVVAKINGQEISEEELIGDDKLTYIDIKKREYEFKMGQVNKMLVEKLVGAEAKKANLSTEDYIKKNVIKGEIKISDKEYKKFVAEKKIPESQINAQLKERIDNYLKEQKKDELLQAYLAKLTKSSPVELYFKKPKLQIDVAVGNSPSWGDKGAKVKVIEFSDFQCPFCARGAEVLSEIKKKYKGKVEVAFKHFPLPMHPDADPASQASMCVHEQSADKFWTYHDLLFKNQDKLNRENFEKLAKDVGGIKLDQFKKCLDEKKFAGAVKEDLAYGEKIGVRSTPTFFVNGQLIQGALPIESFAEIIDEELKDSKVANK